MRKMVLAGCLLSVCLIQAGLAQEQTGGGNVESEVATESISDSDPLLSGMEEASDPSVLELLRRGGPLMYPIYLASFIMVAFGIERAIGLQKRKILPPEVVSRIRDVSSHQHGPVDVERLLSDIESSNSPIVRVVRAGLRKAYRSPAEIEKAIEDAGAKEAAGMRRNCKVLSVTASVSPLLGLLGTVLGMIKAFMTVASREEALGRTELLASGIYQALVTTAAGLCIAIPALVLYYIFTDKVERLIVEMDDLTIDLVERMSAPGELSKEA